MTVDRIREIVDQKFLKEIIIFSDISSSSNEPNRNRKLVTKVTHCLDFTLGNLFVVFWYLEEELKIFESLCVNWALAPAILKLKF
jgi:hypothetical protein